MEITLRENETSEEACRRRENYGVKCKWNTPIKHTEGSVSTKRAKLFKMAQAEENTKMQVVEQVTLHDRRLRSIISVRS